MNSILLVDDDENFKETFLIESQQRAFTLVHKRSFEGLRDVLPKFQNSLAAVVLDIKCLTLESQIKEDEGFIGTALRYLDTNCAGFPRIILTGDDSAFKTFKDFNPNEIIFQKTPEGLADAFKKLTYYSENSIDLKNRRENIEVFKIFESGLFEINTESVLLNTLKEINETEFAKFGGILRNIRSLQEVIYKTINKKNKKVVPDHFFKDNGMIKFNELMTHLNGNSIRHIKKPTSNIYQNSAIFNLADSLYWTSGKYIHADPSENYCISNYTIKSLLNSLMELFIWSRTYLR